MLMLHSIEPIQKVFQTSGSHPVLVSCNDRQKYVCKYVRQTPANKLFIEYLITNLARIWKLQTPEYKFVVLKPEHIPDEIAAKYLKTKQIIQPVYGVLYLQYARDIDNYFAIIDNQPSFFSTIQNPYDLLKVSLFDIWLSNEDRNHNNYNLLLNPEENGNYFYVIDHEKCLNSNSLKYGIYHISFDESILNTSVCELILKNKPLSSIQKYIQQLEKEYYFCIKQCEDRLLDIVKRVPQSWGLQLETQVDLIRQNIFTKEWTKTTFDCFEEYLSMALDKHE